MERIPVTVGKQIIHLRKIVDGFHAPILLIHGLGVSGDYYVEYAKMLSPYFDVYIIDLPGYGKTPKPPKPLNIRQLSVVVLDYVKISGIKDFIIVGQSMGCQIIVHAIAHSPSLFKKAILLSPTTNKKERILFLQGFRLLQDTFHEKLSASFIVFTNYARMGIARFFVTAKYMVNDRIEDTIKNVSIPILIVCGSKDKISPKKWCDYLASIANAGSVIEMQSTPHLLQYQKPQELVKITREFTKI